MKQDELKQLLTDLAADRLALLQRHEQGARLVSHYDFNNTYQYVINREESHLSWVQNALSEFAAPIPGPSSALAVPSVPKAGKKVQASVYRDILADDATHLGAFVTKWRPRAEAMTHARHRQMLNVILGESLEHKRFFDQAANGFEDLLGRRTGGVERQGAVLPTRWLE